jgi:Surface antigen variable number repeat
MGSARVHVSFLVMVAFGLASASLVASDALLQAEPRKLARIDFVGNRFFEADTLQKALRLVKPGDERNRAMLKADIEMNLKGFFKEQGFIRCELSVEDIEEDSEYVSVQIRVTEGKQYRLSELRLMESPVFSDEVLIPQFALQPGDIVNFSAIKQGLNRIKRMYRRLRKRSRADRVPTQAEASQMRLTKPPRREDARITKPRDARLRMLAPACWRLAR